MDYDDKVQHAKNLLARALKSAARPVVLCSFGKDSIAALHLVRRELGEYPPVVFHRVPAMPWKYAFADRVIQDWQLRVIDYPPLAVGVTGQGPTLEIVASYQNGVVHGQASCTHLNLGVRPPTRTEPWLCAREDLLHRPTGTFNWPWDAAVLGHRGDDVDPERGPIGVNVDVVHNPGCAFLYPLRTWSREDVWKYIERWHLPYDSERYDPAADYRERGTHTSPDYWPACTACVDPAQPAVVICPKNGLRLSNSAEFYHQTPLQRGYFGEPQEKGSPSALQPTNA